MTATDGDVNAALRRLQGEVDRLTKERDEAQRLAGTMSGLRDAGERDYDALKLALAASQAEAAKLLEALEHGRLCGNRLCGKCEERVDAALSRAPGGREALREIVERAARFAVECFERNECDFVCMGGNCLSTDPERVKACMANDREAFFAAIVASLLPEGGEHE